MLNMFEYAYFFDIDIMNYEWNYTILYFNIIIINYYQSITLFHFIKGNSCILSYYNKIW